MSSLDIYSNTGLSEDGNVKEGYLVYKKRAFRDSFRRKPKDSCQRYLVLGEQTLYVYSISSAAKRQLKDCVDLRDISVFVGETERKDPKEFYFKICHKGKQWTLCSATENERDEWVIAILSGISENLPRSNKLNELHKRLSGTEDANMMNLWQKLISSRSAAVFTPRHKRKHFGSRSYGLNAISESNELNIRSNPGGTRRRTASLSNLLGGCLCSFDVKSMQRARAYSSNNVIDFSSPFKGL